MQVQIRNLAAEEVGSLELADAVFGVEVRPDILHRVVLWQLAKRRAGTHKVKTRAEIARTGAKLYKQKGTGRARHGSRRVNLFRGGGVAHGPVVRDHATDLPKKVLYPFGGSDLISALAVFPDAEEITIISLES